MGGSLRTRASWLFFRIYTGLQDAWKYMASAGIAEAACDPYLYCAHPVSPSCEVGPFFRLLANATLTWYPLPGWFIVSCYEFPVCGVASISTSMFRRTVFCRLA